jgi:hypothetical protein
MAIQQQEMALQRQMATSGTDLYGDTSGPQASAGIGSTDGGQSTSSPSSSPIGQDVGTSSQPIGQDVGTSSQPIGASANYRRNMANYYAAAINLNNLHGNTAEAERLRQFATSLLHSDYGATTPQEMLVYHNAYANPKGDEGMGLASSLENKLARGVPLMPYEAQYMARYADVNSPLTATSDGRFVRGGLPITPAMMQHLQKDHGINLGGFPAVNMPGQEGAPAPGAGVPSPQVSAPTVAAAGPQWNLAGTPAAQAAQEDAVRADIMKTDPTFAHALASNQAAEAGISSLSVPNEDPGAPAAHRAGMAMYIKTMLDNARVSGQSQEQIDDLTSKLQQARDYWEKMFNTGGTLPPATRKSMAQQMFLNARNAAHPYNSYWGEGSEAEQNLRARGLNPRRAIPAVGLSPDIIRWATVPEAGQPAPGAQAAPGPAQAPGPMSAPGNVLKNLGL